MSDVVRINEFDPSKIKYGDIRVREKGSKNVRLSYNGKPLMIQFPTSRSPFGLNVFEDANGNKYSVDISLGGTEQLETALNVLKLIDEQNITFCLENSKALLGKEFTRERFEDAEIYSSVIKQDKDKKYPPRFKMRLPVYDNTPDFAIYNNDRTSVNLIKYDEGIKNVNWEWAQPGMEFISIAECKGLWIVGKNVYCSWNLVQMKIKKSSGKLTGYAFHDDEDEISEGLEKTKIRGGASSIEALASDEEEEDEELISDDESD